MTEAYEIGISLALRDGVSESIGVARRDMAAIEAAIAASGVPLQKLHEAASGLWRANKTKPALVSHQKAERVPAATPNTGGEIPTGGVDKLAAPRVNFGADPVIAMPAAPPGHDGSTPAPATTHRTPALETAPVASTVAHSVQPDQSIARTTRRDVSRGSDEPNPPPHGAVRTETPTHLSPKAEPRIPQEAGSGPATVRTMFQAQPGQLSVQHFAPTGENGAAATVTSILPATSRQPLVASNAPETSTGLLRGSGLVASAPQAGTAPVQLARFAPAEATSAETSNRQPANTPTPTEPAAAPGDGAVAPIGIARYGPSKMAPPRDVAKAAAPAPEPVAQSHDQRPTEGDVYLDGALVGRWLARHMAREVGRPGVGPTGFDARRNPLRPGATIGD